MQIVGMKHLTFILTLSLISFFLIVGCSEQSAIKQQDSALIKKIEKTGNTKGYVWLEQYGMGEWYKSVLFFGYADNYGACTDFIEISEKKYGGTHRCVVI